MQIQIPLVHTLKLVKNTVNLTHSKLKLHITIWIKLIEGNFNVTPFKISQCPNRDS